MKSCVFRRLLPAALSLVLLIPLFAAAQEDESSCEAGERLFRSGKFEEARPQLRRCLDEGGESVDVLLPLTVMAIQGQRPEEAVSYSARAVDLDPENAETRYWHGRALLEAGRVDDARAQWESGLRMNTSHNGILEGMAKLAMADGETAKAYNILTQLQRSGVDEAWVHRLLADIAASKGLWAQTLTHMNDVMVREEPDLELLVLAMEVSLMAQAPEQALDYGRRAVRLMPCAASFGGLGEVFFATEQVDSALVYLRRAVEMDPTAVRARFNLANALEISGLGEEAEIHFLSFLEAVPNDPVGQFNYAVHLQKRGRLEEAVRHVSMAVSLDGRMLTARVVRAQMLEGLGRYGEALEDVVFLREADPANAAELAEWERRIRVEAAGSLSADREGKIHLLHLVVPDPKAADQVVDELAGGETFSSLVVRFSVGPAAQRGGDIGWIDPADMVEPMRAAISNLELNEVSPPVESGGLTHIFKRIP